MNDAAHRIYAAIAAIPPGRVASYGAIAVRAGLPGRARLVGKLLGETPDGLELPWHRVLRASGQIALPPDSDGFREQSQLLRAEGVEVKGGRVPLSRFGLDGNLDRALWGMPRSNEATRSLHSPPRSNEATCFSRSPPLPPAGED